MAVRIEINLVYRTLLNLLFAISLTIACFGGVAAGQESVALCVACHGEDGISKHDTWPNLAGQDTDYLILQLQAFRDGTRKSPMMYPAVFDLSDDQIESLAAYYNQLNCAN